MCNYPVIDLKATGKKILELRVERGLSVKDLQEFFGFENPQAIYKWQSGQSLPSVDNLFALSRLFNVTMEDILAEDAEMSSGILWVILNYKLNDLVFTFVYIEVSTKCSSVCEVRKLILVKKVDEKFSSVKFKGEDMEVFQELVMAINNFTSIIANKNKDKADLYLSVIQNFCSELRERNFESK